MKYYVDVGENMLYSILQWGFQKMFSHLFSAEILGKENVPLKGAVILAANHLSNFDPPFLATYLDRPVFYMAKKELFRIPIFNAAIRNCHAFPVERGKGDRLAIKNALSILKKGECLGIFPEGKRSIDGKLNEPKIGVALIAALSKTPVIPACIIGTDKIFTKEKYLPKLTLIYGKPLQFLANNKDKEHLVAFSKYIMSEIQTMRTTYLQK